MIAPTGYFVDANLLLLVVVGSVGRDLIPKHRRLSGYTVEDYEVLVGLIDSVGPVYITPNTLTETSNLLAQHADPERSLLFDGLRHFIEENEEVMVTSIQAAGNRAFVRLGLTDAALLEVVTVERPLITVDAALYVEAMKKGINAAVNFLYLRNL